MLIKICTKCKVKKNIIEFQRDKTTKDGYYPSCRNCKRIYGKKFYKKNKEKLIKKAMEYGTKNAHKIKKTKRKYREKNKIYFKEYNKKWYNENRQYIFEYKKKYNQNHKKERNKKLREKYKTDINFRLTEHLRGRVKRALKHNSKIYKTMKLVGCDIKFLKNHLQKQFKQGMSWSNYGYYGWHVDHIKPCASFDLSKVNEQKECFHYTNLQPLWAKDNMRKGKKLQ